MEEKVAILIGRHMRSQEFRACILRDATTEETVELGSKLSSLGEPDPGTSDYAREVHLAFAGRIDTAPAEIKISLSAESLAGLLRVDQDDASSRIS